MSKPKAKANRSPKGKATIEMFKELKRAQIEDVRLLMKAVPSMLAAHAHETTARERQKLDEKIRYCKDRIRFCYLLYTDAVSLLGPKPRWLTSD